MSSQDLDEPWGQLVALEGGDETRIPIIRTEFIVGRKSDDVDFVISDNKCVSSCHCSLVHDEKGEIWLKDTSTNGTLVDGRKVHGTKVKLKDGVVIKIVFRKDHPELNLSYQFFDLRPNHRGSNESDSTLEMTVEYDQYDIDMKRKSSMKLDEEPKLKKQAIDDSKVEDSAATIDVDYSLVIDKEVSSIVNNKKKSEEDKDLVMTDVKHKGDEKAPDAVPLLEKKDSFEETLICQICQEILHDCVSLQPCMHCYCAGCYSDWMEYSKQCPACRNNVERVSKNHIVNNLIESYLRAHPEKKRPEEDIKELDDKNKITKDMSYPRKACSRRALSDDSSPDEDSSTSGYSVHPSTSFYSMTVLPSISPHTLASSLAPPPVRCRQCPGYTSGVFALSSALFSSSSSSSTSIGSFTCTPSTNHLLCNCCLLPMPDRRRETDISVPPQKCDVCGKAFCHMYWGCSKFHCRGCLNNFKDIDFSDAVMNGIVCDNVYESEILKKYIVEKGLTIKNFLTECLARLDSGTYISSDTRTSRISSTTRTCYSCALKNFKDLAYQYREDIPKEELPSDVTERGNCYYGKNCRTQKHNREHCKKYNHICEQTRY